MSGDGKTSEEQIITGQPTSTINPEGKNEHIDRDRSSSNPVAASTNDDNNKNDSVVPMEQSSDSNETQIKPKDNKNVSIIPTDTPSPVPNNTLFTGGNDGSTQRTLGVSSVGATETTVTDEKNKNVATTPVHQISDSNEVVTMDEGNEHMNNNSVVGNIGQSETVLSEMPPTEKLPEETSVNPDNNPSIDFEQISFGIDENKALSVDCIQRIQPSNENNDDEMDVESVTQVKNEPVIGEFTSLENLNNLIDSPDNQALRAVYLVATIPNSVADPVDPHAITTKGTHTDDLNIANGNPDNGRLTTIVIDNPAPGTPHQHPPPDIPEIPVPPPKEPSPCQFRPDKSWLDPQFHQNDLIKKPHELEKEMTEPTDSIDENLLNRIQGSMIGMALGDALGAHVEFRPHQFMLEHPVTDLESGGTWGLEKGQFTDDTSMALCLANSLVARREFVPYDQLVRYKWWHKLGYMSSTGECFDIGAATRQSVDEFGRRQKQFAKKHNIPLKEIDYLSDPQLLKEFNVNCSSDGVAGNGALMRLAPMPLFFFRHPVVAVEYSGYSGYITHGDRKAYDACRYYGALIVGALHDYTKEQLLDKDFYSKHKQWFGEKDLHPDIESIARGSYQKGGYDAGIRGKGYIVSALEAALWAFWSDENSFEKGALAAVNLGDDTDTTAAIYGQLAGAYYGYKQLPTRWTNQVYAKSFMETLSKWIAYEGKCWQEKNQGFVSQL